MPVRKAQQLSSAINEVFHQHSSVSTIEGGLVDISYQFGHCDESIFAEYFGCVFVIFDASTYGCSLINHRSQSARQQNVH